MAHDPTKFWDLAEVFGPHSENGSYTDFEGLANVDPLQLSRISKKAHLWNLNTMQTDLLLHFVFEMLDEFDHTPTDGELDTMCNVIQQLTTIREWMKSETIIWDDVK